MASNRQQLPLLSGPRVIQEVIDKVGELTRAVRPFGHPRVRREDVVGALIYIATVEDTVRALNAYNPELGKALNALGDD